MKIENRIIYNHLDLLTKEEQEIVKSTFENKFPRLQRTIKNDINLIATIKIIKKQGLKKQYFFYLKTESPSAEFAITPRQSDMERMGDWNISKAAHNAINNLLEVIEHRFIKREAKEIKK